MDRTASKERPYGEESLFCILMGELGRRGPVVVTGWPAS